MTGLALSRADRLLLTIVLLLAVVGGLAAWLAMPPEKTGGLIELPSTYYNVGYGTKASYEVLHRLGFSVARLRRPIDENNLNRTGVLFILRPQIGLADHELSVLESWVEQGHALVVVPTSGDDSRASHRTNDDDHDGSSRYPSRGSNYFGDWFTLLEAAHGDTKVGASGQFERALVRGTPTAEDGLTSGITEMATRGVHRFDEKAPLRGKLAKQSFQTLWKDKYGLVGLQLPLGRGTIIALADADPLSNLGLSDADNGLLLANIARQMSDRYPGKIAFDEYHLNNVERDVSAVAMAKLAFGGAWRWATAQAALVAILALYLGAVRFGSPKDVQRVPRRQRREFAEAAGRLLREAGGSVIAARMLYRYYREQICRAVRLQPDVDNRTLREAVRERFRLDIGETLDDAERATTTPVRPHSLLALSRTLHSTVETLNHAT